MMAMISPALESMVETLSTVKFASRAKNIKNQPIVNEDFDQKVRDDAQKPAMRSFGTAFVGTNISEIVRGITFLRHGNEENITYLCLLRSQLVAPVVPEAYLRCFPL